MRKPKTFWVVLALQPWSGVEALVAGQKPGSITFDVGGQVGFLPVFKTRKDAEAWAPGKPVSQIEEVLP